MPRHPRLFIPGATHHVYCIKTDEYFRQVIAYVHLNPVAAGIVEDPALYSFSGHRELLGLCQPHVVDRAEVYAVFGAEGGEAAAEYAGWVRSVAEARLADTEVEELPWWESARHVDEIAGPELRPEARTFDGLALAEERRELTFDGFLRRFLMTSGHNLRELASRGRGSRLLDGRIELITLGLSRYRLRARDFATLLDKHGATVTRWLNEGLRRERDDTTFRQRLDDLDREISDHRDNVTMRNVAP